MRLRGLQLMDREKERERRGVVENLMKCLQMDSLNLEGILACVMRFFNRVISAELERARISMNSSSALMLGSGGGGDAQVVQLQENFSEELKKEQ